MVEKLKDQEKNNPQQDVEFAGSAAVAVTGIIGGVAVALGLPWIILTHAQALDPKTMVILTVTAMIVGGLVALTGAFFGLAMPSHVGGCRHFGRRHHWDAEDWKDWGQKLKEDFKGRGRRRERD